MKTKLFKYSALSLTAIFALGMSGCSSSGGGNSNNDHASVIDQTINQTPITKVSTINGKAVDGYLKNSTVCLDLNQNGSCDASEPSSVTDAKGTFRLSLTDAQKNDVNYSVAQLLVYGGQDSDRPGVDFRGKLQAPNDGNGSVNITPITALVSAYIKKLGKTELTQSDIDSATQKVATALNLTSAQVKADPRASNDTQLINASLQIQSAVNTMTAAMKSTDTTVTANAAEGIFNAFADGLDQVSSSDTADSVQQIIQNAPEAKLSAINPNIAKAKVVAKVTASNVNKVMKNSSDANSIVVKKVVILQNIAIKKIQQEDNISNINMTDFNNSVDVSGLSDANISDEFVKINLGDTGVDVNASDFNATLFKDVDFFQDSTNIVTQINDIDPTIASKVSDNFKEQETNAQDEAAALSGATKIASLKSDVEALQNSTNTATVADAKNMVNQLRETAVTFIDPDNEETNTSTIVGTQADTLKTQIKPALKNIAKDFNTSAQAIDDSTNAFNDSIDTNFKDVSQLINDRLDALNTQIGDRNDTSDWNVTAGDDTLSHTYKKSDTNIVTESYTFNGQTITSVGAEEKAPTSVTSDSFSFTGNGYNLAVTSLSLVDGKITLKASGKVTGTDDSSMTLSDLELTSDFNSTKDDIDMFSNVGANFDGTIVSSGRTLTGKLSIDGTKTTLDGTYTGTSGEPAFVGKIVLNTSLNNLINDAANHGRTDWVDPNALVMATFADGSKSLVLGCTDTYDNNGTEDLNLTMQNGQSVTCNSQWIDIENGYEHKITCQDSSENSVTFKQYSSMNGDKVIYAKVNGVEKIISEAWTDWNDEGDNVYSVTNKIDFEGDNEGETEIQNGKLTLNGKDINITDIRVENVKDTFDRNFDFEFIGKLTHGSKVINATAGITNKADTNIYVKDLNVTDGTNFVKADALTVTIPRTQFLNQVKDDDEGDRGMYKHSIFENFTENYNDYYDNQNNDFDANSITHITVKNLQALVRGNDSKDLTLKATIDYSKTGDMNSVSFNGEYNYNGTNFVGIIEADGSVQNNSGAIGSFKVSGDVNASGFTPFTITTSGILKAHDEADAYALFTRGSDYKLGLHVTNDYNASDANNTTHTVKVTGTDSKGVVLNYKDTYSDTATDSTTPSVKITDKNGTSLGSYGEDSTGNNWEVTYSDNSSETIF